MQKERSGLVAMLRHECPVCKQSSIYKNPKIYTYVQLGEMHNVCPVCHTNLVPETGFYFGAAYVSWALTVALWVTVLVALKVFDAIGWIEFGFLTHPVTFLTTGLAATLLLFPYLFRVSRSIWAYMFIGKKTKN
jgi:RNA polymerase subunit RPABC4/transcription elongation factor Spt4